MDSVEPAGVMAMACKQRGLDATREAPAMILTRSTGNSREPGRVVWGGGEARSVPMKPGNAGGGKGPQLEVNAIEATRRGDWR
jgi:hypothetical protein